ncbi:MAG: O-antigen ligase family protein [Clostridiales bacterium]|nr:O-antigen ligase family protein [Clostridiales bacterium]
MWRISSVYIALILSVFLLAIPPGGYEQIIGFKYTLFLLISGGYVVLSLLLRGQLAATGIRPIGNIGKKIKDIPLAAKLLVLYILFVGISAIFSDYGGTFRGPFRQEGVLTIAIYVMSCLILAKYFRPHKWMLFALGGATLLFCAISFVQLTGANPFTLFPEGYNYYGAGVHFAGEFLGTIGNAGLGGAFLGIAAGVLSMALIKLDFRLKWILAIPLFMSCLLIFEMGVDAAVVALIGGIVLILPVAITNHHEATRTFAILSIIAFAFVMSQVLNFSYAGLSLAMPNALLIIAIIGLISLTAALRIFGEKIPKKYFRPVAIFAAIAVAPLAILYIWFFGQNHGGMIGEIAEILRGNLDVAFGSGRVYIWSNIFERLQASNLLLGTGPDTLGHWGIAPFIEYVPALGVSLITQIDTAHNEFLQILATTGLLSLLAYMGALAILAIHWFKNPGNKISAIAGAGVLFYSIQAMFGISMFITAPFFWACLAVLIYSQQKNKDKEERINDN